MRLSHFENEYIYASVVFYNHGSFVFLQGCGDSFCDRWRRVQARVLTCHRGLGCNENLSSWPGPGKRSRVIEPQVTVSISLLSLYKLKSEGQDHCKGSFTPSETEAKISFDVRRFFFNLFAFAPVFGLM